MENRSIVEQYLKGLQKRLSENDRLALSYASGASTEQVAGLKKRYPDCPAALLELLSHIDGTYWQDYGTHKIAVLILGSDVDEYQYPYYLKSVEQILEERNFGQSIRQLYGKYFDGIPDLLGVGIDPDGNTDRWLCFSECMNNGGTSSLYLDFNPSPTGVPGQVVRFLHDPDSYEVIARNFEEYLQLLIDRNYAFIPQEE